MIAHEPLPAYQAKLCMPCAVLGIRTARGKLLGVDFLDAGERSIAPKDAFTAQVCEQLQAYLKNPDRVLEVPMELHGTPHQTKVWTALRSIPRGEVRTYGWLAEQVGSSPRAVGGACGDNPIPLFIPCHRIVAKQGAGGFMHRASGTALEIKAWLLRHEGWRG